jgi:hypothetical protein
MGAYCRIYEFRKVNIAVSKIEGSVVFKELYPYVISDSQRKSAITSLFAEITTRLGG